MNAHTERSNETGSGHLQSPQPSEGAPEYVRRFFQHSNEGTTVRSSFTKRVFTHKGDPDAPSPRATKKQSEEATREGGVRVLVATVLRGEGAATCAPRFFSVTVEGPGDTACPPPPPPNPAHPSADDACTLVVVLPKKESKPELVFASGAVEWTGKDVV